MEMDESIRMVAAAGLARQLLRVVQIYGEHEKSHEAKQSVIALKIESGAQATDLVLCVMEQKRTMFFVIWDTIISFLYLVKLKTDVSYV